MKKQVIVGEPGSDLPLAYLNGEMVGEGANLFAIHIKQKEIQMEKMFETAMRMGLRFETVKGLMTTEDLFTMKLKSNDGFNLNAVALKIDEELTTTATKSFVEEKSETNEAAELKMEIVKYVISIKLAEKKAELNAKAKKEKKAKILALMANKQNEVDAGKSMEDLQKELDELD